MSANKIARPPHEESLQPLVDELVSQLCSLTVSVRNGWIRDPSLRQGATSELWTVRDTQLSATRDRVLNLTGNLNQLLLGPHGYFHDLISSNWDLGALYTILEVGIPEKIPLQGYATASELAAQTGLPERKLLNLLRLATCSKIFYERDEGVFGHTALSEELLHDEKFRAFIGFQLFETRVASANLADSLRHGPNSFENGQSAFKYAFGSPLYQWHQTHTDKGKRFRMAMESVTATVDPGDALFCEWFEQNKRADGPRTIIDLMGGNQISQKFLSVQFPDLEFRSATTIGDASNPSSPIFAYTIRNIFWNKSDPEVVDCIRDVVAHLEKNPQAALLLNEMLSPDRGEFDGDLEHAYRRRDVTTMTMHNAKQRTQAEWRSLFAQASPKVKVQLRSAHSSHSYRGLWELRTA